MKNNYTKKLEIDESDRKITQDFLSQSTLSKEEFNALYWQVRLIHQAIDFPTLRMYSYQRLKNSTQDKYPDLIMELDDEKDGIYKQVRISPENMTISIELCKNLKDGYFIAECIEFWNDYESYFSRKLFKINYPKKEEVTSLAYKEWQYNGVEKTLEEMPSLDFTATTLSKSDKEYLEATPSEQKHYIRCLSKNK